MASCEDYFSRCQTTPDVHNKLMTLLVCDFLQPEAASLRFRMNCRSHVTPAVRETASVERYLNYLEEKGEFREGNYDFIKQKVEEINVAITDLIIQAERKIGEIRENSLKVETIVTDVEPTSLEEETRSRVTAILLSVSEILICKSNDPNIEIHGLWERYRDYQALSYNFLSIWHTEYCRCQKRYGQQMLLQFLKFGATKLESGQNEYDFFRSKVVPSLWLTLKESVKCTCDMLHQYGASPVSVARSSVLSYWIFDCVTNLDKLWRTYEEGGLHVELQDFFNTEEALRLFKVDRITLKMTIQKSDYLKYRSILEKTVPKDHSPASRLQTLDLNPVKSPVETIITTEGDPLVDSKEALKLHYTKGIETATETEYSKHFEKIKVSLKDPLSDPDIVKVKREKKAPTYLASRLQTRDLDPVKYPVETTKTTEGDPLKDSIEALKLVHAKGIEKTTETEYSKHFEKIEASLKDPFSNPDIAQVKRGEIPIYFDLMKKRLYEINKRLSQTPTVLSYLLQSDDKMTRESLYASVSLLEYHEKWIHSWHATKIKNIPDHIFCTSDEYIWKERRSSICKRMHGIRHKDFENTNSTFVFIYGEAGCGKTSYCKHLLRQWCRGEELQKFDHVFYIDTSVLQTSKTRMSNLISSAVFGNVIFSENHVDIVLRNEKCLILIDGDEYFRGRLPRVYEIMTMKYCNCVFVFLMRNFMTAKSFYSFEMLEVNVSFIQLLGLDEKGMASLYSDVMIESNKMKQSERGHEIKKGGDSQQIMNKPTLQDEKGEPDTALSVTESNLFQSKGESDTQAYTAQNSTDLEQLVKNPDSGDFTKEAETKPKTEKDVSKHDRKELEFYKIKGILERGLRENYDLIMKIPMFGSVCVGLLAEGKDLPRNFTNLYLCLIDKLVGGHEYLSGDKGIKEFDLFLPYVNVHRHVETLCILGNIAFNSIFSPASELLNYKDLDGHLEETEIDFAIRTGLLIPVHTLTGKTSDEQNVRFLHKTIRDSLVSIYIVIEKEEVFDSFCQQMTSMDVIKDVSHVIMMVCGLNPNLGCRMTRSIKDVFDKDENVIHHRQNIWNHVFMRESYYLQLSWYSEYKDKVTNIGSDTKDSFYVSDIYVDDDTDKDTVTKTIALLSDKNVIVTSLYINGVPAKSGLSDKVLNDFLAFNTSLETMCIEGGGTCRSIEPLSFPFLTVLTLWDVHIQPASSDDDTTKPLLYHLPMLETLDLLNIPMRKILLGFSHVEGKMPKLKTVHIRHIDMDDQSIELAPDMADIKEITLLAFKMTPQGWMKFIQSLFNIHHSYDVDLLFTDIDTKSLEMVRSNESFVVKRERDHAFEFSRA